MDGGGGVRGNGNGKAVGGGRGKQSFNETQHVLVLLRFVNEQLKEHCRKT